MKILTRLFSTLCFLLISACSTGKAPPALTGEWILIAYGETAAPTPAVPGLETSITFNDDGTFGGTVGCNSFGADYTAINTALHIDLIVSTEMFCDQSAAQESTVFSLLSDQTLSITLNGTQLTLTSADGASVVILEKK